MDHRWCVTPQLRLRRVLDRSAVLEQAWQCVETGEVEWRAIPQVEGEEHA